ncbi:MAG TPA: M20/M25/M40 family metallo-hydrolase [Bryobacteraceae bacterium]|jgi:acetylornithine deacetylase|nr:M20/M25/M40 family metallo-hydrolase [Bryobacteraceae bacterium]
MDVVQLTRALVDIESTTGNEGAAGEKLVAILEPLAARFQGTVERMEVEPGRFNVLAVWGQPVVTLSTHMDTVPPFLPSREDEENIWGRGACDAKGIIASMICAAANALAEGRRNIALLFLVGEERNSAGAYRAAQLGRGSKFVINGEPTENKLALGSKGTIRYELDAYGRMAHSAYPELGESAIEKLLDALGEVRKIELPRDPVLGKSTLNIGIISGGRAPNVIPDFAQAHLLIRLVDDAESTRASIRKAVEGKADAREVLFIPVVHLGSLPGIETTVVSFTTDIPALGGVWGQPFLIGPGTIHVAHTEREHIAKRDLFEAVRIYQNMIEQLSGNEQNAAS